MAGLGMEFPWSIKGAGRALLRHLWIYLLKRGRICQGVTYKRVRKKVRDLFMARRSREAASMPTWRRNLRTSGPATSGEARLLGLQPPAAARPGEGRRRDAISEFGEGGSRARPARDANSHGQDS